MDYTNISYHLYRIEVKTLTFVSVKSEVERNQKIQEITDRKLAWVAQRGVELQKLKEDYPDLEVDEQKFFGRFNILKDTTRVLITFYFQLVQQSIKNMTK